MNHTFKPVRPLHDVLRLLVAPLIWFAHLTVVYGAETLICLKAQPSGTAMIWAVGLATAAALIGLAAYAASTLRNRHSDDGRFLSAVSLVLALLSSFGVLLTTLPPVFLPACASAAG